MKTFINAHGVGEVVLGPSTSQLLDNLGNCYSRVLGPGDEVSALTNPWLSHSRAESDRLHSSNCKLWTACHLLCRALSPPVPSRSTTLAARVDGPP